MMGISGFERNQSKLKQNTWLFKSKTSSLNVWNRWSLNYINSPSKCLVWVKKCCHLWFDQNFDPSLLTNKLWLVFKRKFKKKSKWRTQKKLSFSKSPILDICFWKFHGLVELIHANGIDVVQPMWSWGCREAQKQSKNIFGVFRPFLSFYRTA